MKAEGKYSGPLDADTIQELADKIACTVLSAGERTRLEFDRSYLKRFEPFKLALRGKDVMILFAPLNQGQVIWVMVPTVKGKGYPNLGRTIEQIDELAIFVKIAKALSDSNVFCQHPKLREI